MTIPPVCLRIFITYKTSHAFLFWLIIMGIFYFSNHTTFPQISFTITSRPTTLLLKIAITLTWEHSSKTAYNGTNWTWIGKQRPRAASVNPVVQSAVERRGSSNSWHILSYYYTLVMLRNSALTNLWQPLLRRAALQRMCTLIYRVKRWLNSLRSRNSCFLFKSE